MPPTTAGTSGGSSTASSRSTEDCVTEGFERPWSSVCPSGALDRRKAPATRHAAPVMVTPWTSARSASGGVDHGRRRTTDPSTSPAELETLGYGALWSSGGFEPGLSPHFERLLASTARLTVASGIVSIWASSPEQIASAAADLETKYPGRFLLGLGASHAPVVENYSRPYERMVGYLDGLDHGGISCLGRPTGARRPRSADAGLVGRTGPRSTPLFRPRRAHGTGQEAPWVGPTSRSRGGRGCRARPGHGTPTGEKVHEPVPHAAQLHPRTCAPSVTATTTCAERGVIDWSTRWWRGVTWRPWLLG